METNNVIDGLVKELRPVRPLRPFGARYAIWLAAAGSIVAALVLMAGVRRELELVLRSGRLMIDAGLVLLIAATASWSALRMSVPGDGRPALHRAAPAALFVSWLLFCAAHVIADAAASGLSAVVPDAHPLCAVFVFLGAAIGMAPMTALLRAAAPLEPRWCGAAAGLAAAAATLVGIELICVYESPAHVAGWHAVPAVLLTAAGAWLGPRLLSKK